MEKKLALRYQVDGDSLNMAGEASTDMKMALKRLGIAPEIIRRAAICMYEGEINMVIHARGGEILVEIGMDDITIVMADRGSGIEDIDRAMQAGFSTADESVRSLGFGAGMGLPNMKQNSDEMKIDSVLGVGTTVTMLIRL